jgi:hypothetical protein
LTNLARALTPERSATLLRWEVISALMLVGTYVPYALTFGSSQSAAEATAAFGGLTLTALFAAVSRPASPAARFASAAWPVAWWPVLYPSAVAVIELDRARYADPVFFRFDAALFGWTGGAPSTAWLGGPLEEVANLFYVSYYVGIPLGLLVAWTRSSDAATRYAQAVLVSFATCAVLWLVIPTGGLHLTGGPLTPAWGPFTAIAREIYATNPHYAAAFPSSHVALAFAAAGSLVLDERRRWPWVVWAGGIAFGTVFGQYHYTADAAAGLLVGVSSAQIAFRSRAADD